MKTDLEWIWDEQDERLVEPDPLGDLATGVATEDRDGEGRAFFEEGDREEDEPPPPKTKRERKRKQKSERGPEEPKPERTPKQKRVRARRRRVGTWTRGVRWVGPVLLALAVGTVAPQVVELSTGGDGDGDATGAVPRQQVVGWHIVGERGQAHVAVAASGVRAPVVVAMPAEVTINLPGQNLGTLEDAAQTSPGALEVAVENLLGVPLDRTIVSDEEDLAASVDAAGGIELLGRRLDGSDALDYLAEPGEDAPVDAVYLRWQDVLDGLIAALEERPAAVGSMPEPLRPAFDGDPPALVSVPVIDIGAGLLRPDVEGLERVMGQRFVGAATEDVRLVVLNGVGVPGIGEEVARILVPEGFQLVSSGNARDFDFKVTQIVASSNDDVPAARRARSLLGGIGKVSVGNQPAGLTDVTIVVGRDFGGS